MKLLKRFLVLLLVAIAIIIFYNYPKLNIVAGYSAKNTASSIFLANRSLETTDTQDNNFSPVNLASDKVDTKTKSTTASVFGLLTRKAIYREGLGSVLISDDFNAEKPLLVPKRLPADNTTAFPYGNAEPKDTLLQNVNYNKLNKIVASIFKDDIKTRSVLVVYKNQIIAEKYADGFTKNSRFLGWSMAKSITSTIFGILQYKGQINVQEKAPIDAWKDDERNQITIHNLLQMNSGLEWEEDYNTISDVTKMLFLQEDMTQQQMHKPLVGKPNKTWNYSSGTTNLLSGIIRKKLGSHQTYLDYWYTELIDKIGMNSMVLETDMSGNYVGSSYAWATTRDWAKFGLLYLHKGNWNNQQIFDASWVDYVTQPTPTSNGTYGAQFWLNAENQFKDVPKNMFYADGYQGQRVYILPNQELVIVRFGLTGNYDENNFLSGILSTLN